MTAPSRCRIFVCLVCKRIVAGCTTHPAAVVEPIESCCICASNRADRKNHQ